MLREVEVYGVQFLSRDCIRDELHGTYGSTPSEGGWFSLAVTVQKGTAIPDAAHAPVAGQRGRRPLVAHPWPMHPSIGAVQFVDPYYDVRWPVHLLLSGTVQLHSGVERSVDEWIACLDTIHSVLWGSFETMADLRPLLDQRTMHKAYRYTYFSTMLDFFGNPLPAEGSYKEAYQGAPIGPGFVCLPVVHARTSDGTIHQIARVWSQALSMPDGATRSPEARAQELQRHWNAYQELADAAKHAERGDAKATIRSAASAVDAAIRFYCVEWGFDFSRFGGLPFSQKIDAALETGGRPRYANIDPGESTRLLHLYRARNAMHEGDCYYKDDATGQMVDVDIAAARAFLAAARRFVLWIETLA